MSDTIVLRKVFAVDSNTGLFISSGSILLTNGVGGTYWSPLLSSLTAAAGPIIGNIPSTLSTTSTTVYVNTSTISYLSTVFLNAICSLGSIIDSQTASIYTAGLGSIGYVSTQTLEAAISTAVTSPSTISTLASALSTFGYATLSTLSTFQSSLDASTTSSLEGLGTMGYISVPSLCSTVAGLGNFYISSINTPVSFQSTVAGLGSAGYVSTPSLCSTVAGLGNSGYVSTASLISTVGGLSTFGYVNNFQLTSTAISLSNLKTNIRFDNVTTVTLNGGVNTFSQIDTLIYRSTFYQSSIIYSGAANGVQLRGNLTNPSGGANSNLLDMEFSTATLKLDAFSSFIIAGVSRITLDIYPTLAFTKLATGASNVTMLPISTILKYGNQTLLRETTVTSHLYAGNTRTLFENVAGYVDASNIFNQPIRMIVPNTTTINYAQPYTLYHYMPSSINNGALQNALHSNLVTPYFGSTGSIFVTVQNSL